MFHKKKQINRATAINTNFTVAGESKSAEDLGLHTSLENAQELSKEESKSLHANLHTDLLNRDEREKVVTAGRKLKVAVEALLSEGRGGKENTLKEGLFGIAFDRFQQEKGAEISMIQDSEVSWEDKLAIVRKLQEDFYRGIGYTGELPKIYLTNESKSFTDDTTGEIFLSLSNLSNPNVFFGKLLGHELTHRNQYNEEMEASAEYVEGKISFHPSAKEFSSEEKQKYLRELETYKETKNLEEQTAYGKERRKREYFPEEDQNPFRQGMKFVGLDGKYLPISEEVIQNPNIPIEDAPKYFIESPDFLYGKKTSRLDSRKTKRSKEIKSRR